MASSDLQLSGLASGFDWKSLITQLMAVERAPINRLNSEKSRNTQKSSALANLGTKLTALQDSATALGAEGAFSARTAASTTTSSTWTAAAAAGTAIGNYKFAVTQLATASVRTGGSDIGSALSTTTDVSGTTLANLPVASAITAGTFTVNGKQVTVALTDSLQTVFDAISTATSGAVTAAYSPSTDKITLTGTSQVVLGAANDTTNILAALKLANNGTTSVTSSSSLGTAKATAAIASANLRSAITAVDGSGNGSFTVNGVSIAYNVNTESIAAILTKINQSTAGVTAVFDASNDRVSLTNNSTGDVGISVSETAGGLADALGLTSSSSLTRGKNALFTLNDGAQLSSTSNVLDSSSHGVTGLDLTVNTETTQTIQVASDTKAMRAKVDDFVAKFNDVQDYIDTASNITTTNGKVTAAILADNRQVQEWASALRTKAFASVSGLSGSITRLEHLGVDFSSSSRKLTVKDSTKLDTALRDKSTDVDAFFRTATTGFAAVFKTYLTDTGTANTTQQANFTKANTSIDKQVADIERRLAQQQSIMESAFIAMELAQQKLQTQQAALSKAFAN